MVLLYHVSDEDGLHLGGREVAQNVGGKQGRHLEKEEGTSGEPGS